MDEDGFGLLDTVGFGESKPHGLSEISKSSLGHFTEPFGNREERGRPTSAIHSSKGLHNANVSAQEAAAVMEKADNIDEAKKSDIAGLIPLCVLHHKGPRKDPALYGYDIALLETKAWRAPGSQLSQYFNYGFNEQSWRTYCALQVHGQNSLLSQAEGFLERLKECSSFSNGDDLRNRRENMMMDSSNLGNRVTSGNGLLSVDSLTGSEHAYKSMFHKTRLCHRFREGTCRRGDQCNYAHGQHELRSAATEIEAYPKAGGDSDVYISQRRHDYEYKQHPLSMGINTEIHRGHDMIPYSNYNHGMSSSVTHPGDKSLNEDKNSLNDVNFYSLQANASIPCGGTSLNLETQGQVNNLAEKHANYAVMTSPPLHDMPCETLHQGRVSDTMGFRPLKRHRSSEMNTTMKNGNFFYETYQ